MTAGRPLEFDPQTSLEGAMELFWSQGYEATSLQQLLSATGLSRSSLYQQFGGKSELFSQCLDHYCNRKAARMQRMLNQADSGLDFIREVFYAIAGTPKDSTSRRGCLLMNTASEFGLRDPDVAEQVAAGKEAFAGVFQAAIERGQHEGDIPPDRDSRALADYLVANMSGLRNLLKTGMEQRQARSIVATMLTALE